MDAGFYQNATLGDYVWLDRDDDGIQDSDEPGIRGATVNLRDSTGNTILQTVTTGAGGAYSFTAAPGSYIVEFTVPGVTPAKQDQGGNDALDSDASVATGRTGTITLTSGQTNNTVDTGFYTLRLDLGDLPDIYKTIFSPGPAHVIFPDGADADSNPDSINGIKAVWLGTLVDTESNGVPGASAIGDDVRAARMTKMVWYWQPRVGRQQRTRSRSPRSQSTAARLRRYITVSGSTGTTMAILLMLMMVFTPGRRQLPARRMFLFR